MRKEERGEEVGEWLRTVTGIMAAREGPAITRGIHMLMPDVQRNIEDWLNGRGAESRRRYKISTYLETHLLLSGPTEDPLG